ncbi:DNA repair protein RecO [Desulfovibrio oxyclinae]|uniref:DNA repair protein RecO n=1 Tax=Desulfovibrio oxyclinae TaxID=63560 RepID=UPI00035EC464|nr:DNA repair protein RecO [Desulfovibrio oxyclinae]
MRSTEKAIVLKVGRFREADAWVRILTPTHGIFNAFAFGGLRSRRRFTGCLDTLNHVLFSIAANKTGTYYSLEEGSLIHGFQEVKKNPAVQGLAVNCVQFVRMLDPSPGQDSRIVYDLLLETLEMLEEKLPSGDMVPFLFRAKAAFDLGYRPAFDICASCGREAEGMRAPLVSVESGQVFCAACQSRRKAVDGVVRRVSPGVLRSLEWIRNSRPADWARLGMTADVARQSRRLIEAFVAYHLGLQWENGYYKKV